MSRAFEIPIDLLRHVPRCHELAVIRINIRRERRRLFRHGRQMLIIQIDPSIIEKAVKPEYLTWDMQISAISVRQSINHLVLTNKSMNTSEFVATIPPGLTAENDCWKINFDSNMKSKYS